MEELLEIRVSELEKMIRELAQWTNFTTTRSWKNNHLAKIGPKSARAKILARVKLKRAKISRSIAKSSISSPKEKEEVEDEIVREEVDELQESPDSQETIALQDQDQIGQGNEENPTDSEEEEMDFMEYQLPYALDPLFPLVLHQGNTDFGDEKLNEVQTDFDAYETSSGFGDVPENDMLFDSSQNSGEEDQGRNVQQDQEGEVELPVDPNQTNWRNDSTSAEISQTEPFQFLLASMEQLPNTQNLEMSTGSQSVPFPLQSSTTFLQHSGENRMLREMLNVENNAVSQSVPLQSSTTFPQHRIVNNAVCGFCHRGLRSQCALKVHLRTHTGERPFRCPHCTYAAAAKGTLKRHLHNWHNQHEPQKQFQCDICYKKYKTEEALSGHRRRIHGYRHNLFTGIEITPINRYQLQNFQKAKEIDHAAISIKTYGPAPARQAPQVQVMNSDMEERLKLHQMYQSFMLRIQ